MSRIFLVGLIITVILATPAGVYLCGSIVPSIGVESTAPIDDSTLLDGPCLAWLKFKLDTAVSGINSFLSTPFILSGFWLLFGLATIIFARQVFYASTNDFKLIPATPPPN